MGKNENEFLYLVKDEFKDLSDDEVIIIRQIQTYLQQRQSDKPSDGKSDDNKKIHSEVIEWIIIDSKASKHLTCKGLTIKNATITGSLNLENQKIIFPLTFHNCSLEGGISLKLSNTKSLSFYRSTVNGCVNLDSAQIDGQLMCSGASFNKPDGSAFIGKDASITKSVFFDLATDDNEKVNDKYFEAHGKVDLEGIKIAGKLRCSGGKFKDEKNRTSLFAEKASIEGDVLLNDGFEAKGEVNLSQIKIKGQLDCSKASFSNPKGIAFIAQSIVIDGGVFMNNHFKAEGEVNLINAKINGVLECGSGNFNNPGGYALIIQSGIIGGNMLLDNDFSALGEVNLLGSKINGSFYCTSGEFNNPKGRALNCKKIVVERDVYFNKPQTDNDECERPFKANGEVKLCGAQIGGELKCSGGIFNNPANNSASKFAFISKGLKVAAVFFDEGFEPIGEVNLLNIRIDGQFMLKNVKKNDHYKLNLEKAYIRSLEDEKNSWPEKGKLVLDDFIYDNIEYDIHKPKYRIKWLGLNADEHSLQPYRQLASVLDNKGWEKKARDIRIAMNNKLRKETHDMWEKFWLYITGKLFDYGFKPFKVWKIALIIWLLGALIYSYGNYCGLMQPPKDSTSKNDSISANNSKKELYIHYPEFYAIPYSLDVFLPIVDLHQEAYWLPTRTNKECNITCDPVYYFLISWMYFQIMAGWFLTTMLVGGLTGLIRNK